MYYLKKKGLFFWDYRVHSHNFRVFEGVWMEYSKENNVKEKLISYAKKHKLKEIAISGELIGPKIQRNIYKRTDYEFYLFNAYTSEGKCDWPALTSLSEEIGIPTVPYLGLSKLKDLDVMLRDCEGSSALVPDFSVPREGVVWRNKEGNIHFKVKSRPYKVWFEK